MPATGMRTKAVTGVEVRDPTADIDVVSYCLAIPPEQYLAEGTDRSLIRRAMSGVSAGDNIDKSLKRPPGAGFGTRCWSSAASWPSRSSRRSLRWCADH